MYSSKYILASANLAVETEGIWNAEKPSRNEENEENADELSRSGKAK